MESIKTSLSDMMDLFQKRMADFETELHNKAPSTSSSTTLATEFAAFRTFIIRALGDLQQQVHLLARSVDDLEMRGRRKMLLLHGVAEKSQEDTAQVVAQVIKDYLKLNDFTEDDIKRCHRFGRTTTHRPRPIVIKLHSLALRDKIWFDKTKLKGTGITISEFLTRSRHDLFMAARDKFGVSNCWTREGCVYILGADGVKHRVACREDWSDFEQQQQQQQQPGAMESGAQATTQTKSTNTTKLKRAAAKK